MNPENLNESDGESSARTLNRRSVLGTTASLGIGLFAGCSANSTNGQSEDAPVDTETETPTATATEERVEYPRKVTTEEIQSTPIEAVYELEQWASHPNNEEVINEVNYERIEAKNSARVKQIKEVLKETAFRENTARRNGVLGMVGLTGLSWVATDGENMLIDEMSMGYGGRTPVIEMVYEDENSNTQISVFNVKGVQTDEKRAKKAAIDRHFYEEAPSSELNNGKRVPSIFIDIIAMKKEARAVEGNTDSIDNENKYLRSHTDNFILGMNDEKLVNGGETVPITPSEEYWSELHGAFSEEPETYKDMKIELSKAAHNVDHEAGNALNAKIENGKMTYEEITGRTYEEIAPQFSY